MKNNPSNHLSEEDIRAKVAYQWLKGYSFVDREMPKAYLLVTEVTSDLFRANINCSPIDIISDVHTGGILI